MIHWFLWRQRDQLITNYIKKKPSCIKGKGQLFQTHFGLYAAVTINLQWQEASGLATAWGTGEEIPVKATVCEE